MKHDGIEVIARRIRRERKAVLLVFPVLILFAVSVCGYSSWRAMSQIKAFGNTTLSSDTAPCLVYALAVRDANSIMLPLLSAFGWLLVALFLAIRLLPSKDTKLLLKIADKIAKEDKNQDPN